MGIDQEKRNLTEAQKLRLVSGHDFWQSESIADVGIPAIRMSDGLMAYAIRRRKAIIWGLTKALKRRLFRRLVLQRIAGI
nr:hypothetical protein [Secundilactobacillus kimchicus]